MHFNPCGRAVDWIRFPFEVNARLLLGEGAPDVRLRWEYTDQPWIPRTGDNIINNRNLNEDQVSDLPIGQFAVVRSNYVQDARWRLAPGFKSTHMCESVWFATGEPWPNDLPPTQYDDFQIPACCGDINHAPTGGVMFGGQVNHIYAYQHAPTGGVMFGGVVVHQYGYQHGPTGGVMVGGAVGHTWGIEHAPTGGVMVGGAQRHDFSGEHSPDGGVMVGGLVAHAYTIEHAPTGGVMVGGSVAHAFGFAHAPDGGVMVGGAVGHTWAITHAPDGGVMLGGLVGHTWAIAHAPDGGVMWGGAVSHTFDPGQPTPGTNCAGSATVNQGQTYTYNGPTLAASQWFTFTLPSTGTWHLATTGVGGMSGVNLQIFSGGSCPFPNLLAPTTVGPPRWVWNGTSGDVIRLQVQPAISGTPSYTFVWDSGS